MSETGTASSSLRSDAPPGRLSGHVGRRGRDERGDGDQRRAQERQQRDAGPEQQEDGPRDERRGFEVRARRRSDHWGSSPGAPTLRVSGERGCRESV